MFYCNYIHGYSAGQNGYFKVVPFKQIFLTLGVVISNFIHPTLPVSFGRDTKSRWSLLSCIYARGSKKPIGGKYVT